MYINIIHTLYNRNNYNNHLYKNNYYNNIIFV